MELRLPKTDQVIRSLIESPLVHLCCIVTLSVFVGLRIAQFNTLYAAIIVGGILATISLFKIKWAVWLLVVLSPFHYVIKELSTSVLIDVWREGFLMIILWSWLLQIFLRRRSLPPRRLLTFVLIAYVIWGIAEIFNSASLIVGIAGFRYMFSFLPLYFIAMSTIDDETDIRRYMKGILATGVIIGAIAVVQFVLVSLLGILEQGTYIDFARKYAVNSYRAAGIPWDRSNSILIGPNELGVFLASCLTLAFGYYLVRDKSSNRKLLFIGMLIMAGGLLASMSRSAMIGMVVAWFVLGSLKGRAMKPVVALSVVAILLLLTAPFFLISLFEPVVTFSDAYFTRTLELRFSSQSRGLQSVWDGPILGQGYGLSPSAMVALGIDDPGVLRLGGVDIYAIQSILQIGIIGFLLFCGAWFLFLKDAYRGATNMANSIFQRNTAAGICATMVGIMVTSAHVAAWDYVSFGATYYVLGAIATKISTMHVSNNVRLGRT